MDHKILEKLCDKTIAILGFGMEGKSSYRFIRKYSDMFLTILDQSDIKNDEMIKDDPNVRVICGEDYLSHLDGFELILKSPGVITKDIDCSKYPFTSQLELLLEVDREKVIGITATKGKSTTCTLLYEVIKNNHKDVLLLGNIGKPIFDAFDEIQKDTYLVIEMSALQLEFVKYSPHIAAILNLYQDHLDHSGTLKHYHENKLNIFRYQTEGDYRIYFEDIEPLNSYMNNSYKGIPYKVSLQEDFSENTTSLVGEKVVLNEKVLFDKNHKISLIGDHNLRNIMVVLTISEILGLDLSKSLETIYQFKTLEHRLEYVGMVNDVIYYNDSISTTPQSTLAALKALPNVDTLIFGGMDRGIDYQELVNYLNEGSIHHLICMPTTGHKIGQKITNPNVNCYFVETLEEAVLKAKEVTPKKHTCIMSPAASSYEYFKNFEEKGKAYKNLVKRN